MTYFHSSILVNWIFEESTRKNCFMRVAYLVMLVMGLQITLAESACAAEEANGQTNYQILAPDQAKITSKVKIDWLGKQDPGNYITIVSPNASDREYEQFEYTNKGSTLTLFMPIEVGFYEIRLNSERLGRVLARKRIEAVPAHVDMTFPEQVAAGSEIEVEFHGTLDGDDWITIAQADAQPGAYQDYQYCKEGSPTTIHAPEEPGMYEIRYMSGFYKLPLLSKPITVKAASATIRAQPSGKVGHRISVQWEGPAGKNDYLAISSVGASNESYFSYQYLAQAGEPVELMLPIEPGDYEIRYQTGNSHLILARQPIQVISTPTELKLSGPVKAGENFNVNWQGPDGEGDYIAILRNDEKDLNDWSYTKWGNPVELKAPDKPGRYRLCYQNRNHRILVETVLDVTPSTKPGSLSIVAHSTDTSPLKDKAVEVILDASGSMLKREGTKTRMAVARSALEQMVQKELGDKTKFALRVFGHHKAGSCQSDLEIPLSVLDKMEVSQTINRIQAQNLAKTPIADSLDQVVLDLVGHKGPAIVILLTDGEETCSGDPKASIQRLINRGKEVRINVVGFSIGDNGLKRLFKDWAQAGNGVFLDASTPEELTQRMAQSLHPPFRVVNGEGKVIKQGTMDKEPIPLKAGSYQLEWGDKWNQHRSFEIKSGLETNVKI
jgi:hypothetical protein